MKSFFIRLVVFLSPIAILITLVITSAFYLGEAIPIPMMIQWQAQSDEIIVYQPWYGRAIYDYKFAAIQYHQPSIMIMGSSRMTYFRAPLANRDTSQFYNASIDGTDIYLWNTLLDGLIAQGNVPEVIFVGLDFSNYAEDDPNGDFVPINVNFSPFNTTYNARYIYSGIRRVAYQWFEEPLTTMRYLQSSRQNGVTFMGLSPLEAEHGYMADGSRYIWGFDENDSELEAIELEIFTDRRGPFRAGTRVNQRGLNATERFLATATENNIEVIGILPPYKPYLIDLMDASGDFTFHESATIALQNLFAEYNAPIYDFTDPRDVGGSEDEMIDSWHFSDLLSLRIYHHALADHPEILGQFSDLDTLSAWLDMYQDRGNDTFLIDFHQS